MEILQVLIIVIGIIIWAIAVIMAIKNIIEDGMIDASIFIVYMGIVVVVYSNTRLNDIAKSNREIVPIYDNEGNYKTYIIQKKDTISINFKNK